MRIIQRHNISPGNNLVYVQDKLLVHIMNYYPIDANEVRPLATQALSLITLIGPIYHYNLYLASRHPLPTVSSINPFSSLHTKLWLNYTILCAIIALALISISVTFFKGRNLMQIVFSSSESILSRTIRSGLMLYCLISFTFWTFIQLYGVDLASVLVGKYSNVSI